VVLAGEGPCPRPLTAALPSPAGPPPPRRARRSQARPLPALAAEDEAVREMTPEERHQEAEEDNQRLVQWLLGAQDVLEAREIVRLHAVPRVPDAIPARAVAWFPALRYWEVWRSAGVTAACLAAYLALTMLPVPGVDQALVSCAFGEAASAAAVGRNLSTMNAMRVGLTPAINASITLSIMTSNLMPRAWRDLPGFQATTRYKEFGQAFERDHKRELLAWTLLFAACQCVAEAVGAAQYAFQPGLAFTAATAGLLMGGTLVALKLSNIITKRGLGEGLSVIICSSILGDAVGAVSGLGGALRLGLASGREVAAVGVAWAALIAVVVAAARWEVQLPLRSLRLSAENSDWWRSAGAVSAEKKRATLPLTPASNAMMVFIFSQAAVYGVPAALASVVPALAGPAQDFMASSGATSVAMVLAILVMQLAAGLSAGLSGDKFLKTTRAGLDLTIDRFLAWRMVWADRLRLRAARASLAGLIRASQEAGFMDEQTVEQKVALVSDIRALEGKLMRERGPRGGGEEGPYRQMVGTRVPPGSWQQSFLLMRSVWLSLQGGVVLSGIYLAARAVDAHAKALFGADLHSVSFLIVASLALSMKRHVDAMVRLAGARDEGYAGLAPLRAAGPVRTLS